MASYKLDYFDFKSRAEVIRLIFDYAGQPFVDNRIDATKWHGNLKENYKFKHVPVLEVKILLNSIDSFLYLVKFKFN